MLKNVSATAESGRFHGRPNELISQPLARARSADALILLLLLAACFLLTRRAGKRPQSPSRPGK
ncbi:hypothetical protein ABZ590_21675 [Streptomyces hirsutus]|uniref:hypothetical protein n=1 Tax=Streptomyces hirsutus TaxID=35620 RepID=UPI0033C9EDF0